MLPNIEDRDIDFGATVIIATLGNDRDWSDLSLFPPWSERIPHAPSSSSERQDDHAS